MLVMTSGCLCCSIRGDLVATLEDALRASDNGRMTPFKRVLIETTGLADPAPVLHTVMGASLPAAALPAAGRGHRRRRGARRRHARRARRGGEAGRDGRPAGAVQGRPCGRHGVAEGQARTTEPRRAAAAGRHGQRRRAVRRRLLRSRRARGGCGGVARGGSPRPRARPSSPRCEPARFADSRLQPALARSPARRPRCRSFSTCWSRRTAPRLLRFKGLVALADDPARPAVVHAVQHIVHPLQRLDAWPDDDHATRLVFIVQDLDESFVAGLWSASAGEPGIDRADPTAGNPLAPAPGGLLA